MGNPTQLAVELDDLDEIERSRRKTHSVSFTTNYGHYDAIPTKVLELLVEHDATLYDDDYSNYDYVAIV